MHKLLKLPYWFISVFTWDKSFRNNPIIGNYFLNQCGLHLLRVTVSHLLFNFRLCLLSPLLGKPERQAFKTNGYIVKYNFLPEQEFTALKQELCAYNGEIRETIEGDTFTQRLFLNKATLAKLPKTQGFVRHNTLTRLMRYCSSKNRLPLFYVEKLKFNNPDSAQTDPQKDLHIDTFHPCVKAWFFFDDVDDTNGPHIYIPGSQRLSWRRLRWEYRQSLIASRPSVDSKTRRYWDGSFRVNADDLAFMQSLPAQIFRVPANTLLIANTHGIHRRGDAQGQSTRMTVWMQARDNPFNPFFMLFPELTASIFEFVWQRMMDNRDKKLVHEGKVRYKKNGFN